MLVGHLEHDISKPGEEVRDLVLGHGSATDWPGDPRQAHVSLWAWVILVGKVIGLLCAEYRSVAFVCAWPPSVPFTGALPSNRWAGLHTWDMVLSFVLGDSYRALGLPAL